jgi:hypothetical protein
MASATGSFQSPQMIDTPTAATFMRTKLFTTPSFSVHTPLNSTRDLTESAGEYSSHTCSSSQAVRQLGEGTLTHKPPTCPTPPPPHAASTPADRLFLEKQSQFHAVAIYQKKLEDSRDYITKLEGCYTEQSAVNIALKAKVKAGERRTDIPRPKHAVPHSTAA